MDPSAPVAPESCPKRDLSPKHSSHEMKKGVEKIGWKIPSPIKPKFGAGKKSFWDEWQHRIGTTSLALSMLMQLSYVAFPAYNFALAIWATVHPFSNHRHNSRSTVLFVSILVLSCITDIVWSCLWISGQAFYNMMCQPNTIGILQCDGLSSYPGCGTNRFAAVMFIANIALKLITAVCIWQAVSVVSADAKETKVEVPHAPENPVIHDAPVAATEEPIQ
ncbi:hypothetical protein THRCLA_11662 [Thraustotheca clavata]|uniref:Transmembrane protein n=1 Tax=Thraustotheca clavata TaxID=74557 RepID=A0A1V9Y701_9STRA|nr:hypothetical protein THRCLA_11662 [Thraustotheca clavata]